MRAPTFFDKNFTPFVFVLSAALALAVCGFSLLSIFRVGFEVDEASYLAGSIYLGSHIFRVVRLIALSIDDPRGAYLITPAHLITAPLGFFLPFKLGEVFRVIAIAASFKSLKKGILIWLLERVGDVFVLLLLGILLLLLGRLSGFSASSMLIALTIASTLILLSFWALFDLSSFLIEILVLRSQSKLGFFLLKQTSELRALAVSFRKSLSGRLLTLLVSSIFICLLTSECY
ncbi:MAG: hypothetical protein EOP06_05705 [Proteobacteria bacterium]|nr:MAG: hypothetical protein EOP06_05705 [Pseudomonadota bacterium]